jgi:hypothetical protein
MQRTILMDLKKRDAALEWRGLHDIEAVRDTRDGIEFRPSGPDPFATGPVLNLPSNNPHWLIIRMRSTTSGMLQIYWWEPGNGRGPTERQVLRLPVRPEVWLDVQAPLPGIAGKRIQLRIDPPGDAGTRTVIQEIAIVPRAVLSQPPSVNAPDDGSFSASIKSGVFTLHVGARFANLRIDAREKRIAYADTRPRIGWQEIPQGSVTWSDITDIGAAVEATETSITSKATFLDERGATWQLSRRVVPAKQAGGFDITVSLQVDKPRNLVHFPALLLHMPGPGFHQAIFPGIEYLDARDTSSSEADIETDEHNRQIPQRHQPTIPIMGIQQPDKLWLSLAYVRFDNVSPFFDVPDRHFGTGQPSMGVLFPGGFHDPGSLVPERGYQMASGIVLSTTIQVRGGTKSETVLAGIERWVLDHPLPLIPERVTIFEHARLAGAGFLDSAAQSPAGFRHAYPGEFPFQAAPDATLALSWISTVMQRRDTGLSARASDAAKRAKAALNPAASGGIGHVRTMAPALQYGDINAYLRDANNSGRNALEQLGNNGQARYRKGKVDFARTSREQHANGLSGNVLLVALTAASETGDTSLIKASVEMLRKVNRVYSNTVPRGAQTWEIPLHTPDILASAHMLRANVLGYELTGDRYFFDEARYWAWSGVPFVYLDRPTDTGRVGMYATIAVLGATNWVAPNWIGLPVQWCGLVYADALLDLWFHDRDPRWKLLADGIISSGYQQTWPAVSGAVISRTARERQGLLPDSFILESQQRSDPVINPATLLFPASRSMDRPIYTRHCLKPGMGTIHIAGDVSGLRGDKWELHPWLDDSVVAITGLWVTRIEVTSGSFERMKVERPTEVMLLRCRGKVTIGLMK